MTNINLHFISLNIRHYLIRLLCPDCSSLFAICKKKIKKQTFEIFLKLINMQDDYKLSVRHGTRPTINNGAFEHFLKKLQRLFE